MLPLSTQRNHTFPNRLVAAQEVADGLRHYRNKNPLVLAIPRGAVPMAQVVAEQLGGDLDVVLVHKIGAPDNPEFAVGSVSEFGNIYRSQAIEHYEIPSEYIDQAAKKVFSYLKEQREKYSPVRPPLSPQGRFVVIVDDGIATGATMLAAVRAVRAQNPKRIVVAAPVASPKAMEGLEREADEMMILEAPETLFSISQFYNDFPQVTDEEVLRILNEMNESKKVQQLEFSRKKTA